MSGGQVIIVRRAHSEEDGHHGGVWKIAFADFMTALMAFFLVMWLTSVSDDATKKQIAQYFNPIKLNSPTPATKGLSTGDSGTSTTVPDTLSGPAEDNAEPSGKPVGGSVDGGEDQALFRDPYAVLAEIAAESGPGKQTGVAGGVPDGSGLPGLNGGDAYRDPFDPASWQLAPNTAADAAHPGTMKPAEFDLPATTSVELAKPPAETSAETAKAGTPAGASAPASGMPSSPAAETQAASDGAAPKAAMSAAAEALKAEIDKTVAATDPQAAAGVEVTEGEGGVTISLADSIQTGMFEIGSAKPKTDTVHLMEKIAAILSARKGSIVIRGYTDARPYAKGGYDNWRLSTSRAHMAYYMLSRGGLDEKRVESIEGFADRQPKNPADPNAAANRRIEILLREPRA